MGATFKYILVALILYYLWNNHLKNIVKVFFKGSSTAGANNGSSRSSYQQQYRQEEPKVYSGQKRSTTNTSSKDFKGGEYVDFEEVD